MKEERFGDLTAALGFGSLDPNKLRSAITNASVSYLSTAVCGEPWKTRSKEGSWGDSMAQCRTCGGKAGFGMSECIACTDQREEALRTTAAAAAAVVAAIQPLAEEMVATSGEIIGRTAERSLGVVRGLSVRSRSVLGNAFAGAQMIFGGQITALERLCEDARRASFNQLRKNAAIMGADAVIGLRYDATEVFDGVTEVLCYGTAVKLRQQASTVQ